MSVEKDRTFYGAEMSMDQQENPLYVLVNQASPSLIAGALALLVVRGFTRSPHNDT